MSAPSACLTQKKVGTRGTKNGWHKLGTWGLPPGPLTWYWLIARLITFLAKKKTKESAYTSRVCWMAAGLVKVTNDRQPQGVPFLQPHSDSENVRTSSEPAGCRKEEQQ